MKWTQETAIDGEKKTEQNNSVNCSNPTEQKEKYESKDAKGKRYLKSET